MTAASTVAPRIHQALADYLKRDVDTIEPLQSLRDDLGLDSMATIELLFRIEEAFDIQIPDEDLQRLGTVGEVTIYIEERLAAVPARDQKDHHPAPKKPAPRPAKKPAAKKTATKKKG